MDFEFFKDFIKPELLVLIPVLYFIGMGLKNAAAFADKYIPIVLGAVGVCLSALWVVATSTIPDMQSAAMAIFTAIVQGILVAGVSVYVNQIVKQAKKGE